MLTHADLYWSESGESFLAGELAAYFSQLESGLLALAQRNGFRSVYAASTLPVSVLEKLDYLHSFPHHATFACCLDKTHENIQKFSKEPLRGDSINITQLSPARALLLPAACYSIYPTLQSQPANAVPQRLTVQSRCFRSEEYYLPLERQWNFSMRELVFAGNADQAQQFVDSLRLQIEQLCAALALPVQLQSATDPFFNPEQNPKYIMQRIAPSKTEVVYGEALAIASLNFHRQYFGEAFDIRYGDDFCYTACVAFGLDRWMAALLREHGPSLDGWPCIDTAVDSLHLSTDGE